MSLHFLVFGVSGMHRFERSFFGGGGGGGGWGYKIGRKEDKEIGSFGL
jgi:hypothetical protein